MHVPMLVHQPYHSNPAFRPKCYLRRTGNGVRRKCSLSPADDQRTGVSRYEARVRR
jgi:hypothetical protein